MTNSLQDIHMGFLTFCLYSEIVQYPIWGNDRFIKRVLFTKSYRIQDISRLNDLRKFYTPQWDKLDKRIRKLYIHISGKLYIEFLKGHPDFRYRIILLKNIEEISPMNYRLWFYHWCHQQEAYDFSVYPAKEIWIEKDNYCIDVFDSDIEPDKVMGETEFVEYKYEVTNWLLPEFKLENEL